MVHLSHRIPLLLTGIAVVVAVAVVVVVVVVMHQK
jgi:hypothetical protein